MAVIVQKFGGTSVADIDRIKRAASRAVEAHKAGHSVVMVVSARGKKTDELVKLAAEISETPPPREMDMLLSTGEQESVALMAMAVQELGVEAISLTGGQIGVVTDSSFTKARIQSISTERMRAALDAGQIVIAAGFQGIDAHMNITTLGRGGSDTTATALAAVLDAEECQIYTDVEGVFTTDPRVLDEARKVPVISYDEMLELASVGASVMHSRSIEFAKKYGVPIRVRSAMSDGDGTLITEQGEENPPLVTGVAVVQDEVRVSIRDIPDRPGVLAVIFSQMSRHRIPIDMVVQDVSSNGVAEVTFTVPTSDLAETLNAAQKAITALGAGIVDTGTSIAKISAVGIGMLTHHGVAAEMFRALAAGGISIRMVTTSEIKLSVLVDRKHAKDAIEIVHSGFGLNAPPSAETQAGTSSTAPKPATTSRRELEKEIVSRLAHMEGIVVTEVVLDSGQARVTINNIPDQPGVLAPIFTAVADSGILVDMIVQNVSHSGRAGLSFTVPRSSLDESLKVIAGHLSQYPEAEVTHDGRIAILSVQGIGLRSHTGVGEKMFGTLADEEVNVQLVNTSETRLSVVITPEEGERAFPRLQQIFGLDS